MHNNFYFLRKLSKSLEHALEGTVISECFSQTKDELVIRFETKIVPFFIKAALSPQSSTLSFPSEFHRAKKNSIDLFDSIIGRRVIRIEQFDNERSFALHLSDDIVILFKMHGNKSNIIVFESGTLSLFRNAIVADEKISLTQLDRTIDWSYEAYLKNEDAPENLYFTFGKPVWQWLHEKGFKEKNPAEKWRSILATRDALANADQFFITKWAGRMSLLLFEAGEITSKHSDPINAANEFYYAITHATYLAERKQQLITKLNSKVQSTRSYINKTSQKLEEVKNNNNYKIWADLIMANMHAVKPGSDKILVENFYNENKPIEIKLRKDQSPQKNAETLYRKAKNQQIEIGKLQESIDSKKSELSIFETQLALVHSAQSTAQLDSFAFASKAKDETNNRESLPYHEFDFRGYKIWVGRNAEGNDVLTLKLSYKEDLWLHAKDVSGSHVIIKHQAGKKFPKDVIERAAELAAYNSKRKNDSLCPVIVTPKKFVRKRKGDPAGAVVVEREEIIMVVPKLT